MEIPIIWSRVTFPILSIHCVFQLEYNMTNFHPVYIIVFDSLLQGTLLL